MKHYKFNPILESIIPYASKNIAMSVEGDPEIINLSFGQPDFGPPEYAIPELSTVLQVQNVFDHLKRYEISRGSEDLRRAIVEYYLLNYKLEYDSKTQILVTNGGSGGLTSALLAGTQSGDEVLVPDPSYTLYERLVSILGRIPKKVQRLVNTGFGYDLDSIVKSITTKTRALIINSPENPTGYVCSTEEMKSLVDICQEAGIWLIHDEVYDQFAFFERHTPASLLSNSIDNVILVNSLSKKFGVPGLRIGWIAACEKFISCAAKSQDYSFMALNKTSEKIAEILLKSPESLEWFTKIKSLLSQRIYKLYNSLRDTSVLEFPCIPRGGMFLFPKVTKLAHLISENENEKACGEVVSNWLLSQIKVATVPGAVYGKESMDFIRIVCCLDNSILDSAANRILGAINKLDKVH